ncbi:hypothetical protein KCU93_g378, partial [Aureobasidium melanogenum]
LFCARPLVLALISYANGLLVCVGAASGSVEGRIAAFPRESEIERLGYWVSMQACYPAKSLQAMLNEAIAHFIFWDRYGLVMIWFRQHKYDLASATGHSAACGAYITLSTEK